MRIDSTDPFGRLKRLLTHLDETEKADRGSKSAEADKAAPSTTQPAQDGMKLSPEALELQKLRDEVYNSPDVRQDLVTRLKEDIRSGRYNIDGTRIADSLLSEEQAEAEALSSSNAERSKLDREA